MPELPQRLFSKNNTVILAGEISSTAEIDTENIVRSVINEIGYDRTELGFDGHTAEIINLHTFVSSSGRQNTGFGHL